ncbi:MAG: hypothetical protein ABL893_19480 [Hyphomicrobium sp.]
MTVWWYLISLIALLSGWWLFKFALGYFLPVRYTAQQMLKQYLKGYGVSPSDISNDCIRELSDQAVDGAELMRDMNYQPFYLALDERLKGQAAVVFSYWNGVNLSFDDSPQLRTIKKYNVRKRSGVS